MQTSDLSQTVVKLFNKICSIMSIKRAAYMILASSTIFSPSLGSDEAERSHSFEASSEYNDGLQNRINNLENKVQDLEKSFRTLANSVYQSQKPQKRDSMNEMESVNLDKMERKDEKTEDKRVENEEKFKKFTESKPKVLDYSTLVADFKDINSETSSSAKKDKALKLRKDFESFIDTNSNSSNLGDAHFWLGEIYYLLITLETNKSSSGFKEYLDNASLNYIRSFKASKSGEKKPMLLLKLAEVSHLKRENDAAIKLLDKIKTDYPKSHKQLQHQITELREKINKSKKPNQPTKAQSTKKNIKK